MKKIISIILAMTMIFTVCTTGASAASAVGDALKHVGVSIVDAIVTTLLTAVSTVVPATRDFPNLEEYKSENFYAGNDEMLEEPAENAVWSLGYATASVLPDDWQTKKYYLGGFIAMANGMSNLVEEVMDDMQVRVIAVSDGSGRGINVFANLDSIGLPNADIKTMRAALEKALPDVEINSVNLSSTHCHSCIDTQGLWTELFPKLIKNLGNAFIPLGEMEKGVDTEYIKFLCEVATQAMIDAINNMTEGTLTYAVKTLDGEYFSNKNRPSASAEMYDLSRFVFTPFKEVDENGKKINPTMIVNIAAHPDVAGLAVDDIDNGRDLSGDYIYYMGEQIESKGYNFMFFNGAIAGIYIGRGPSGDGVETFRRVEQSARYGREIANIALNMTNTVEQIKANMTQAEKDLEAAEMEEGGEHYTLWYENWEKVEETDVKPLLNIKLKEVLIKVTNPLIKLVGKLDLINYGIIKNGFSYYIYTEIGYMEMGDIKLVFMPGEIVQDLVAGGASLTADGSFKGKDFGIPSIYEMFGEGTICIGLMNDAIGYVVPDNDYSMAILDGHYQELISLGGTTASSIMNGFVELAKEVK